MTQITYLLGAGASYNALPVVADMAAKIDETISWLRQRYIEHSIPNRYSTLDAKKFVSVITDLEWLKDICDTSKNFSVDTFARKLNISGQTEEYIKLKNILSFYFTIEQRRIPPDIRYDNFWASILKSKTGFPNNVKIVSWNYDFQLELTYQGFLGTDSLKISRETLNVSSLETTSFNNPNNFGIYKLNGSATFSSNQVGETTYWVDDFKQLAIDKFIISTVEWYEKLTRLTFDVNNHLSFAWDHKIDNPFYTQLYNAVRETQVLVVIGYSFPFFNRQIDKLIFRQYMGSSLTKVYFQAPDAEDLRERFLAINNTIHPDNLILRKDIKQFTLPNEF